MIRGIRAAVYSKFKNISEFAAAIGWTRQKASKIVNGAQRPTASEMEEMAKCLEIANPDDFMKIFFPGEYAK